VARKFQRIPFSETALLCPSSSSSSSSSPTLFKNDREANEGDVFVRGKKRQVRQVLGGGNGTDEKAILYGAGQQTEGETEEMMLVTSSGRWSRKFDILTSTSKNFLDHHFSGDL